MKRYELLKDLIIGGLDTEVLVPIGTEFYPLDGYYMCDMIAGKKPVVGKLFVHNNPQLFKEIVQRDWEIVAFCDGCISGHIDTRCLRQCDDSFMQEKVLKLGFTIFSVRRLSDGEMFSVGDKIKIYYHPSHSPLQAGRTIKSFELREDIIVHHESGDSKLSEIHKSHNTEPLPTTNEEEEKKYTQKELDEAVRLAIKEAELALPYAMGRIVEELSKDKSEGSYYHSWQSSIAMVFVDEYYRVAEHHLWGERANSQAAVIAISNNAAKKFLDQLIYVPKPEKFPPSKSQPKEETVIISKKEAYTFDGQRLYTEKELIQAENNAFNAAREWFGGLPSTTLNSDTQSVTQSHSPIKSKYETFSDYKNSQSRKEK